MSVTIKEIAELARVHRSTVDKVLHSREGVSVEVRAKVQKIIDEQGYKPNQIGKALARQNNPDTIAVFLLQVDAYEEIRRGIDDAYEEIRNYGCRLEIHIFDGNDSTAQIKALKKLSAKKISGLVISPISSPEIAEAINELVDKGIPVVTVNTDISNSRRMCFVGQDAYRAGRSAGNLMGEILGGNGRIAVYKNERLLGSSERQRGFTDVISEFYPDIRIERIVNTNESDILTYRETLKLLQEIDNISGIFITCGQVREAARAVKSLQTDKKIKMISFDLYPDIIKLVIEGVIQFTIGQNLRDQGYRSLKTVSDVILYDKHPDTDFVRTSIDIRNRENIDVMESNSILEN